MNWGPVRPARIDFDRDPAAPVATDFGDVYHARASAEGQARHVFLGGNGLPGRWAGRDRFVVLETGFGLGNNFLATWQAWRQDPRRCSQLWYVAVDRHPPSRDDLTRAHRNSPAPELATELIEAWPPLTPDIHPIGFESGSVRLLLAFGDIAAVLPDLVLRADAFFLDGFAPDRNPAMWDARLLRGLPRLAADGATLATWSSTADVRRGLQAAGFEVSTAPGFDVKRRMTVARFAPRFDNRPPPGRRQQPGVRQVAVVGAGLAGAAVARALAGQGLAVTVVESHPGCAAETSGNAGGLFHGVVHGQDGSHSRWLRAGALYAERLLRPAIASGRLPGAIDGLLRGENGLAPAAMQALLDRLGLPPGYVQVQGDGLPGGVAAWRFSGGGWTSPAALCAHWLRAPGIETRYGEAVAQIVRGGNPGDAGGAADIDSGGGGERWRLVDAAGRCLAEADAVVLCNAADTRRLLATIDATDRSGAARWPLRRRHGQTTILPADLPGLPTLPLPLADGGYALRLGDGRLLCGGGDAVDGDGDSDSDGDGDGDGDDVDRTDDDPRPRAADHLRHLAVLRRLTGWAGDVDPARLQGRVGWRLQCDDRLPVLGPVPWCAADGAASDGGRRLDQPRFVPRLPGVHVFVALGSRGITQAALGGECVASWISGAPLPLPSSLLDAIDPARFIARAVRRGPADQR